MAMPVVPVRSVTARCTWTFIWSSDFCIHWTQRLRSTTKLAICRCKARIRVMDSFGRSRALVRGHGWQVFFFFTFVIALPGLALLVWMRNRIDQLDSTAHG